MFKSASAAIISIGSSFSVAAFDAMNNELNLAKMRACVAKIFEIEL
jgi:hypothetical protein